MTMREITAHQGIMIDVIRLSKLKTTLQFISLILLFWYHLLVIQSIQIINLTNTFIYATAIISVISLMIYIKTVHRSIIKKKENES